MISLTSNRCVRLHLLGTKPTRWRQKVPLGGRLLPGSKTKDSNCTPFAKMRQFGVMEISGADSRSSCVFNRRAADRPAAASVVVQREFSRLEWDNFVSEKESAA
jgi:hypothetical protein